MREEREKASKSLRRLSCEQRESQRRRRRRRLRRPRDQEDDCTLRLFLHPTSQSFFFFDGPGIEQSQPQEAKESSSAMLAAAGSLLKCLLFKRSNLHAFFNLFLFSISKSLQSSILEFGGVVAIDVFVETVNCIRTVFRSTLDNNEMFL